ncbi:MAG: hypothetical protein O3A00_09555 [Planctomycetota bacterium]|nr:hypothetical protein [Planctomycetota bacterium]
MHRIVPATLLVIFTALVNTAQSDDLDRKPDFVGSVFQPVADDRPYESIVDDSVTEPPIYYDPTAPPPQMETCDECRCGSNCRTSWYENLSVFIGLEGSKQPQEFGVNAHFGGRTSVNWGIPLFHGLGLQVGTAITYTDNAVQVFERVGEVSGRSQNYTTVGLFQRTDFGLTWGAAYDFLFQDYYSEVHLGQWRMKIGQELGQDDEFGLKFALPQRNDNAGVFIYPVTLKPIAQGSAYWRHSWESGTQTILWLGMAEGFGQRNLAFEALFGDSRARAADERFLFGAEIHAPLNDHFAIFGQANFILPADTGTVDAFLGIVYHFGGGARRAKQRQFAPAFEVANSTSFSVDLR